MNSLERRYRRLLLAYPRYYRARRGLEMLTTLLDAAPADRVKPTRGEAFDLIRGGVRYRLSLPARDGLVALALLFAFGGAGLGAAAGAWLAWRGAPALPDNVGARQIATAALGTEYRGGFERRDEVFGFVTEQSGAPLLPPFHGRGGYTAGRVVAVFATTDTTVVARSRERMASDGWRVTAIEESYGMRSFVAARGDLMVEVSRWQDRTVELSITRAEPGGVAPATAVGGLAGAVAGWLLTGWAARRAVLGVRPLTVVAALLGVASAVALVAFALVVLFGVVLVYGVRSPLTPPEPVWFVYVSVPSPAVAAVLAGGGALVLSAVAPRVRWGRVGAGAGVRRSRDAAHGHPGR